MVDKEETQTVSLQLDSSNNDPKKEGEFTDDVNVLKDENKSGNVNSGEGKGLVPDADHVFEFQPSFETFTNFFKDIMTGRLDIYTYLAKITHSSFLRLTKIARGPQIL